ncbi:UNVERIFIED_CONTAM: Subtilisin-like protease SBT1.7 [Sesamum radiatum]|uniref:Subtilisin-like protease SBT1.7 n=1 Tax=Sesamum radiatum TaxID=300843 RepID=A0AAW2KB18_SESRA
MSSIVVGSYVEGASFFGYASRIAIGMAPSFRVAMYKALCDDGAYLSDILATIDQATVDGVDVLSLSLGIDGSANPIARSSIGFMKGGV